jgi:hypothetical protein
MLSSPVTTSAPMCTKNQHACKTNTSERPGTQASKRPSVREHTSSESIRRPPVSCVMRHASCVDILRSLPVIGAPVSLSLSTSGVLVVKRQLRASMFGAFPCPGVLPCPGAPAYHAPQSIVVSLRDAPPHDVVRACVLAW